LFARKIIPFFNIPALKDLEKSIAYAKKKEAHFFQNGPL
jgi:hypothetical protein